MNTPAQCGVIKPPKTDIYSEAPHTARVGAVEALGLDETLFGRSGPWRARRWCTSIVDVTQGQLLDRVPGRDAAGPTRWLLAIGGCQPRFWRPHPAHRRPTPRSFPKSQ